MYLLQADSEAYDALIDATNDLEQIYAEFAKPMEKLDKIRAELEGTLDDSECKVEKKKDGI